MKVGIDSYCYHRFFGEVYPQQVAPPKKMTLEDFIRRAKQLNVDGVSLESCFIDRFDKAYLSEVKGMLDEYKLDRVFAWGHPDGLEGGKNEKMFDDMMKSIEYAEDIGAKVMRVVGSSLAFRFEPHGPQLEKLSEWFSIAAKEVEKRGIKMAVENHLDFNSEEMLQLFRNVNSPNVGINFDTGNFVRVLDDPVKAMQKLAKLVYATHIKDLRIQKGAAVDDWYFFSCTAVGDGGIVDNMEIGRLLEDNGYEGFMAVEIDFLHPDYKNDEDKAVAQSIRELKRIARAVEKNRKK
jgi:sugar phosphate isomerase/epimerase